MARRKPKGLTEYLILPDDVLWTEKMTLKEVTEKYGDLLTEEEIKKLENETSGSVRADTRNGENRRGSLNSNPR